LHSISSNTLGVSSIVDVCGALGPPLISSLISPFQTSD
jgi:hypothetical protein